MTKEGEGGEDKMRREHKQDNANPESAGALSTHIYASACFFPPHTQSFSTEKSPLLLEASMFTAA